MINTKQKIRHRNEYYKQWRKEHPNYDRTKNFEKRVNGKNKQIYANLTKDEIMKYKEYHKKYMKDYIKNPEEKKKQSIRAKTFRIYGKVPKGYHRHHLNYDSPHNFILIPFEEHKKLHWKN
jgi:uncharacterized protein YaaR (DUF327 family)